MSLPRASSAGLAAATALVLLAAACTAPWQAASPPPPIAVATPSPSPFPSPAPTLPPPAPSPSPSAAPQRPSLVVQIIHSEYGSLTASARVGATCTARAVLPNNSSAPGLEGSRVAGSTGEVSWDYPQTTTETGLGRHFVSCTLGQLSDSDSAPFQVGA